MKTEAELIKRILDGEWRNFAVLVDKYEAKVYSYVFYLMGSKEDAEEIVQDTFVKAYRSLSQFRGEASFSTWLIRIAHFACLTRFRLKTPVKVGIEQADVSLQEAEATKALDRKDRKAILAKAMERLKPDERSVVTLFYYNEYSLNEITEVTELTLSNVKILLHRSRKKLLETLKRMGVQENTL